MFDTNSVLSIVILCVAVLAGLWAVVRLGRAILGVRVRREVEVVEGSLGEILVDSINGAHKSAKEAVASARRVLKNLGKPAKAAPGTKKAAKVVTKTLFPKR